MSISTFLRVVGALLWYHLFNQQRKIAATYVIPIILLIIFGGISIINYTLVESSLSAPSSYLDYLPDIRTVYFIENDTLRQKFKNAVKISDHISVASNTENYKNDTMYVIIEDFNETVIDVQIQLIYPLFDWVSIPTELFSTGYLSMSLGSYTYSRYVLTTIQFLKALIKLNGELEYSVTLHDHELKHNEVRLLFGATTLYTSALYFMFFILLLNDMRVDYTRRVNDFFTFQGVPAFYQGFSWILVQSFMALIYTLIPCLIYFFPDKAGHYLIEFSNIPLLFTLMYIGFLECIGLALLCSKFAKTPLSMMVAIVLYVIAWVLSLTLLQPQSLLECFSLFHPAVYGTNAFVTYFAAESNGIGAHWSNIEADFNPELYTTSLSVIIYGLLGSILLCIIALYSYIFTKAIATIKMCIATNTNNNTDSFTTTINDESHFNDEECVLSIKNLSKIYSNGVQALTKVNMKLYEGQITAILGQNGAGKSTIMNILVGLEASTSGEALLNGKDIFKNPEIIRKSIGFCPQENIFLTRLTVKEHLQLICKLKDVKFSEEVATSLLLDLNLYGKMHRKIPSLSGGEQRRVSIAMGLIAQPSLVILDEPTSAVDPATRRILWKLFTQHSKSGKTILISTHFLEEAEVLSQRAAIISKGHLKAIGSPEFLKSVNGSGYLLSVPMPILDPNYTRFCPNMQCIDKTKGNYKIPKSDVQKIPELLTQLDKENAVYHICESTIEDVFVQMSEPQAETRTGTQDLTHEKQPELKFLKKFFHDIYASFLIDIASVYLSTKKLIPILLFILFSLSIQLLTFQFCNSTSISPSNDNNGVILGLRKYSNPKILISGNGSVGDFKDYLISKNYKVEVVQDVANSLTSVATADMYNYIFNYPFGIEVQTNGINCIFNLKVVFAAPDCLLVANNFMFHQANLSLINISFANVKHRNNTSNTKVSSEDCNKYIKIYIVEFCLTIFILYLAIEEVYKRSTKMSQFLRCNAFNMPVSCFNQFISLLIPTYFVFTCNYILLLITTTLTNTYLGKGLISWIFYFFYSMATAAYIMNLSRMFSSSILVMLLVFFIPYIMYSLIFYEVKYYYIFTWLSDGNIFFLVLEILVKNLSYLFPNAMIGRLKEDFEKDEDNQQLFKESILIFFIQFVVYFLGTVVNDSLIFRYIFYIVRSLFQKPPEKLHEFGAISALGLYYKYSKCFFCCTPAVDNLNLNVPKQKCYGLLGVNGAGKSTTFELLAGSCRIQQGDINLMGVRLVSNPLKIFRHIGYCPQFDVLPAQLNSYQLLHIFAESRGIPECLHQQYSDYLISTLDLKQYASKPTGTYSGGNKRKLTTALAFIGFPDVILLDEATTGIDPITRLKIQRLIETAKSHGSTVLISSHSMEECENSCDEIAIMARGTIVCQGSTTDLKNNHGRFYTVSLQLSSEDGETITKVKDLMKTKILLHDEEYIAGSSVYLYYKISTDSCTLIDLFTELWDFKCEELIHDYTVSQSTLETIFMDIAEQYV